MVFALAGFSPWWTQTERKEYFLPPNTRIVASEGRKPLVTKVHPHNEKHSGVPGLGMEFWALIKEAARPSGFLGSDQVADRLLFQHDWHGANGD